MKNQGGLKMKKLFVLLTVAVVAFTFVNNASAYNMYIQASTGSFGEINSGEYMFTVYGNDSQHLQNDADRIALQTDMNNWFANEKGITDKNVVLEEYAKKEEAGSIDIIMQMAFSNDQRTSGTWSTSASVEFYVVKSSIAYALYWNSPLANSGTWNVEHLPLNSNGKAKALSHLTTYNEGDVAPVPEPSTILLMGIGILGLAGYSRKRFAKKS